MTAARPVLRRRWSLRRRLVASCVALVAVVCAVIGSVTIFALHDFLYGQLDAKVQDVAMRSGPHHPDPGGPLGREPDRPPALQFAFLAGGGQEGETVGALVTADGTITGAAVSAASSTTGQLAPKALTSAQARSFASVPRDGRPHTLHITGLGTYRVESASPDADGSTVLVGMNTAGVEDTLSTLLWVEVSVAAAGLVAAGLAGAALMRIALEPLRRLAATATRVSELPLHSGEVVLHERVPDADADPRTEVGQVGAALNRMLGHVGSALHARQESETRVRQFVADASHELRTPLAGIRGFAELYRMGALADEADVKRTMARIENEAVRLGGIVEDLLTLVRMDEQRPVQVAPMDLRTLAVDALHDTTALDPTRTVVLTGPGGPGTVPGPAHVLGDEARLRQVVANLVGNAVAHTPPGTAVRIGVGTRDGHGVLEVADSGPGLTPEQAARVFERFYRVDASRSRHRGGGAGLGLSIVAALVTAHHGHVELDTLPGRGATFRVRLPSARQPVQESQEGPESQEG
ncbi:HAMP domain-containing sensor histidine kinase [Actinacidiphila rubida]|uniref:HAMP domain-containing sensor histidine kinase n=1 Tax=Actinacidiphila rubida TaxID=310780 RepID=UPI000A7FC1AE|nr:HAMP domain-containing sensor histidine kinase [Actinacidiphila rubida]